MDKKESSGTKDFFDVSEKLSAPGKKSLRERQREEAEAKRLRDLKETEATLEDFRKSFGVDDDEDPSPILSSSGPPRMGTGRHFAPRGPRGASGPGSLGPPPPSRKRAFDGAPREESRALPGHNNASGPIDAAKAFQESDDEDDGAKGSKITEKALPKPTMRLSSLPPNVTQAEIRKLIPSTLSVEAVRITPSQDPGSMDRRSASAIVTLSQNTPAKDIDAVVNVLEKRYLGFGYNLSISRHLSSAALESTTANLPTIASSSQPFGAKTKVASNPQGASLSRAPPPPSLRGAIPPPAFYGSPGYQGQYGRASVPTQVSVKPPSDLKQVKLINRTIESLINLGPEFEALLMSRPDVQRSQRWEWLWNPRSPAGVWYRWRLWQIITGDESRSTRFRTLEQKLFQEGVPWVAPEQQLPFEFTTKFEDIVTDPDYDSSDEEASDDESRRPNIGVAQPESGLDQDDLKAFLNPLKKSKLTHLLARLPTSTARLRKGDVARVSAFAISHADKGADEIVEMLIDNIMKPFALSKANPDVQARQDEERKEDEEAEARGEKKPEHDPSSAKLIGLFIISDIFASCGISGVRQAWRYREWFEAGFKKRKVFEHLGRLDKELQWGRLRAEKWKRSINNLLNAWDSGNVFSPAGLAHFVEIFNNPPPTEEEKRAAEKIELEATKAATKSKWKTVDVSTPPQQESSKPAAPPDGTHAVDEDVDGEPMAGDDVDGEPMDGDVDGEPMEADDADGEPMEDVTPGEQGEVNGQAIERDARNGSDGQPVKDEPGLAGETEAAKARRKRPRAEDMFADSDGE
ncbi:uncharacterized protein J3D65DRAFT_632702 [Phyllosticta citribraziliensis]|uniref:CID domain-containing protein n=1 Tax=Phyllosticta citribraziliensis TaxID=989973 RepID=A0ABR1LG50_9PEZI